MKGIVLAGGKGSRLFPITISTNKHLLPVYDKPMIYYSLSVLMLAGIRDIALITNRNNISQYQNLLGCGKRFGIKISYFIQDEPKGIAEAFIITEDFINNDTVALVLGDNIFFGYQFTDLLLSASKLESGAQIFTTFVSNPSDFAVAEVKGDKVLSITEKPIVPISNLAVTGLYFYDNQVCNIAKDIKPSKRGELEITDVNNIYLEQDKLTANFLGRGFAWLDTGTHDSLLSACDFVRTIENRQGLKIACLEEIAFQNGWITKEVVSESIDILSGTQYAAYLEKLIG